MLTWLVAPPDFGHLSGTRAAARNPCGRPLQVMKVGYIIYRVRGGTHVGGDSVDGQWPQRRDGLSEF